MPRQETAFDLRIRETLNVNMRYFFVGLSLINFLLIYIKKEFVFENIAAIKFMDPAQRLVFEIFQGIELVGVPVYLALQFTVIGFVIWTGCFLWGYRVTYYQCWKIVMIASVIFLVPQVLTILWFTLVENDPTYWQVEAFSPLSFMNLFNHETLNPKYFTAFKSMNVFQVLFWFALIKGIDLAARKRKDIAQAIVFTSYVPVFLFWLWFVVATH